MILSHRRAAQRAAEVRVAEVQPVPLPPEAHLAGSDERDDLNALPSRPGGKRHRREG
jgi:hypothetical protein